MNSTQLYDDVIRRHNNEPVHFVKMESCSNRVMAENFICGDRFELCVEFSDDKISSIHFHGLGCAVSKASASVLCDVIEGKTKSEALKIADQFLRLLKNELMTGEKLFSEDFASFGAVHQEPARYDCAALVWDEFRKFINSKN